MTDSFPTGGRSQFFQKSRKDFFRFYRFTKVMAIYIVDIGDWCTFCAATTLEWRQLKMSTPFNRMWPVYFLRRKYSY